MAETTAMNRVKAAHRALLWTWVIALAVAPARAADEGAGGALPKGAREVLKYAPSGAVGVVHIDVAAVRKPLAAAFAGNEAARELMKGKVIEAIAAKVDSLDLFVLIRENAPVPVIILRGSVGAKDLQAFFRGMIGKEVKVTSGGNGRHTFSRVRLQAVVGAEAKDLDDKVVAMAPAGDITKERLAGLGKPGPKLTALLGKVDTRGEAWAAMDFAEVKEDDAPLRLAASVRLRGAGKLSATIVFRQDGSAREFAEQFGRPGFPLREVLAAQRQGATVTLAANLGAGQELLPQLLAAVVRARSQARRVASSASLRMIGHAAQMYAARHDDNLPPSLAKLCEEGMISASMLVSPVSGRGKLKTDAKGVPTEPGDYVYIALPPLKRLAEPGNLVMAYEKPDNYKGEGTNVLFADGSVKWMRIKAFRQELERTRKWLTERKK